MGWSEERACSRVREMLRGKQKRDDMKGGTEPQKGGTEGGKKGDR
jgi:hypothetical protein